MNKLKLSDISNARKITWQNVLNYKVLSQAKIDIANHPATHKVIVGAKGTGKSVIPLVKSIVKFENDPYFNAFGFRKYKEQATTSMSDLFFLGYNLLKLNNFTFDKPYELKRQSNAVYRMDDKRVIQNNQSFKFGSLENVSGSTDGGGPSNGGYYGLITIDEPVIEKDANNPDKIPSKEKWKKDMAILFDNLERFNDNFADATGRDDIKTEIYYTMNNWGDHPLTLLCDEVLPEDEFIKYIFDCDIYDLMGSEELVLEWFDNEENVERLLNNNTLSRYQKDIDTLFTRMTKFANPNNHKEKKKKRILNDIKSAMIDSDINWLTILLGMKSVPVIQNDMLVYPKDMFDNIEYKTSDELEKEGWNPMSSNYGVDIDTSRVLSISPTIYYERKLNVFANKAEKKILVDRQIEIPAYGTGEMGELNDVYVNLITKAIEKHWKSKTKKTLKNTITVDDNRKIYLHELYKKEIPFITGYKMAQKNGMFDISTRQDVSINGLINQAIAMHPKNKLLIGDMQVCVKRDIGDNRRKTTGTTNYLDRIDCFEYGIEPYTGVAYRAKGGYNV